jgi:hypothetical protein
VRVITIFFQHSFVVVSNGLKVMNVLMDGGHDKVPNCLVPIIINNNFIL